MLSENKTSKAVFVRNFRSLQFDLLLTVLRNLLMSDHKLKNPKFLFIHPKFPEEGQVSNVNAEIRSFTWFSGTA